MPKFWQCQNLVRFFYLVRFSETVKKVYDNATSWMEMVHKPVCDDAFHVLIKITPPFLIYNVVIVFIYLTICIFLKYLCK